MFEFLIEVVIDVFVFLVICLWMDVFEILFLCIKFVGFVCINLFMLSGLFLFDVVGCIIILVLVLIRFLFEIVE